MLYFKYTYKNQGHSTVLRFGALSQYLKNSFEAFNNQIISCLAKNSSEPSGSKRSNNSNKKDQDTNKILHPVEIFLIKTALSELQKKHDVVTVDIFA